MGMYRGSPCPPKGMKEGSEGSLTGDGGRPMLPRSSNPGGRRRLGTEGRKEDGPADRQADPDRPR